MNIFTPIPSSLEEEDVSLLINRTNCRIERIVSRGHVSPPDYWYDQEDDEWVLVLSGYGVVEYEDTSTITLYPGDHLFIPAHCKHRVKETAAEEDTLWLAVFIRPGV